MSETATAQITGATAAPQTTTDSRGRVLTLRKMGALQKLRLFKACGANAGVGPYLGMALLASAVSDIDGVPVVQPENERQIEALIQKLGDEGIEAVGAALSPSEDDAADAVASAKN